MKQNRSPRRRRGGYSLLELLMTMTVLLLATNVSVQLFRSVIRTGQVNQDYSNQTSRIDAAISQLRADAWESSAISVALPRWVQLAGTGKITWTITDDAVRRTDSTGQVRQWPGIGSAWTFASDKTGLTVTDAQSPGAPPYRLVSQVLLNRRAPQ
jgi:type II secretory pathway pseudopilin PulG